ncbi:MAG TPA: adenylate/guanylate cyclase domain-containing protein, partial [Phormidium sp.]
LYVEPQRWDELIAYLKGYNSVTGFESEVYRKDKSKIWISENVRAIYAKDGSLLHYEGSVHDIGDRKIAEAELRQQRFLSERLLLNVLPQLIAERLKRGERTIADSFSEVSVLFADIVNFTPLSSQISPRELVELLNNIFSTFDSLADRHKVEKIKTIGDAYMVVGGLPRPRVDHLEAIANMALDMQREISHFFSPDHQPITLRIGIHTGPVVAGVIGKRKSVYDLWGDTVNIASRMESQGEAGYIQVTQTVYDCLKENYQFKERGSIAIKGKGLMTTYWLLDRKVKTSL